MENSAEFSASTVATTISLATVIMAFFELAPQLGGWLLWAVVTTAIGLLVVRISARKIWDKLVPYGQKIPTLHEFLGTEYGTPALSVIGAACTSLGFLGALAVELTVGSTFLANLIPGISAHRFVFVLALVALGYTAIGGFRTVIVTDRYQMFWVWLLLGSLAAFYLVSIFTGPGPTEAWRRVPKEVWDFSDREGLWAFLIGIAVINIPTFLSDMSIWQRVASVREPVAAISGLSRSVASASITWGVFALLACLAPMAAVPAGGINPLIEIFQNIFSQPSLFNGAVLFFCALGFYAAMMSTASTQLIAVSHTIYEDLLPYKTPERESNGNNSFQELQKSRAIVVASSLISILIVEILSTFGFTIADLVFAIYGAQLGLFPPVLAALLFKRERLVPLGAWAAVSIGSGFVFGWGAAFLGKATGEVNLVFLSPAISLLVSALILGGALLYVPAPKGQTSHGIL
ncbi:MAG: hypothetical protein QF389_07840 [Planctomycetota bacterium]|nr:hypothetical protein [Planctomycetota bacterium]